MRRRPTQILSILLVFLFVFAAAGCGKKKTTTSTTTTTVTEATTTTTAASETTTSSATSTSASGAGSLAANCKKFSDLSTAFAQAVQGARGDAQKQVQVFQQFASQTPENIRPDFETLASAYSQIADALKGAKVSSGQTPDAATIAKLLALSQKIQNAKFQAALQHVEAWVSQGCPG